MAESFCRVGGDIEICFETFGDPADPAVLLVMGLGTQMLGWHEDFCTDLAARGFHVIRYDNRDIGRSTILTAAPVPSLGQIVRRDKRAASYTLAEMAADGVGLLDHLGIERAHLVGVSMGGMIAQTIAARRPDRVLTLTSIMSSTGSRWRGQPALRTYRQFLRPVSSDRATYIAQTAALFDIIGSPGFEHDPDALHDLLGRMYDRGHDPGSVTRQLAAILASGDRTAELRRITAPTLVIHGTKDRLVSKSGGRATARAIPGARLLMIEGMGHDLPRGAWPQLIAAIVENTGRAAGAAPAGDRQAA
jgi:pimeloyl-ACP methyl ester carboxylesterase